MFSLSLTSLLLLMSMVLLAFLAVAGVPAVLASYLLLVSLLILARRPCFIWCLTHHIIRLLFFCYLTIIGISNIRLALEKLSDFNILDKGLNLSDYRISDSQKISVVQRCYLLQLMADAN